jgi:hypothetical protein
MNQFKNKQITIQDKYGSKQIKQNTNIQKYW